MQQLWMFNKNKDCHYIDIVIEIIHGIFVLAHKLDR